MASWTSGRALADAVVLARPNACHPIHKLDRLIKSPMRRETLVGSVNESWWKMLHEPPHPAAAPSRTVQLPHVRLVRTHRLAIYLQCRDHRLEAWRIENDSLHHLLAGHEPKSAKIEP
jgi:hypothetical protein